jgi:hypothetical protein
MGFIDAQALKALGEARQGSDYGRYLLSLVNQDRRS